MSDSPSAQVLKAIQSFRTLGFVGLWVHGVPGIISGILLLFAGFRGASATSNNPGTLPGVAAAWIGWLLVGGGFGCSYWYMLLSKKLADIQRPTRSDIVKQLKIGIVISLSGQFVGLLGSFAIVGTLAQRALFRAPGGVVINDPTGFVEPIDLFTVQASLLIIFAHFLGLLISLWLLNRVSERSG